MECLSMLRPWVPWEIDHLIFQAREILSLMSRASVSFVPKGLNKPAKWVVSRLVQGSLPCAWAVHPPLELLNLLAFG
ncbi:conserved hypothetical protein [Ricinus communis]|uniref:Uncharacterized protein n=1 Tax=Ricinus communis TaxID=3988 RepID=B9S830_RICCO|nr:conserved hypothetical protein [Ricinus communis]